MKSNDLIAYAMDFASFLIQHIGENRYKIKNIILFGSIAREDYNKDSDVDIFINTSSKEIEKQCNKILSDFYKAIKFSKYWKLLGITNEFSLKIGELEKWDLKESIIANGISLYGKYLPAAKTEAKPSILFELKIKGDRKDKIRIWRKLYGYTQTINKKSYESKGLIRECNGKKIGKAAFIIPLEDATTMIKYLKKNKIRHATHKIWIEGF